MWVTESASVSIEGSTFQNNQEHLAVDFFASRVTRLASSTLDASAGVRLSNILFTDLPADELGSGVFLDNFYGGAVGVRPLEEVTGYFPTPELPRFTDLQEVCSSLCAHASAGELPPDAAAGPHARCYLLAFIVRSLEPSPSRSLCHHGELSMGRWHQSFVHSTTMPGAHHSTSHAAQCHYQIGSTRACGQQWRGPDRHSCPCVQVAQSLPMSRNIPEPPQTSSGRSDLSRALIIASASAAGLLALVGATYIAFRWGRQRQAADYATGRTSASGARVSLGADEVNDIEAGGSAEEVSRSSADNGKLAS